MRKGPRPVEPLKMTARQKRLLQAESRKYKTGNQQVKRINIILKGSAGQSNYSIAKELGIGVQAVNTWRNRWDKAYEELIMFEQGKSGKGVSDRELLQRMLQILKDRPRSGSPGRFTLSQKKQIVAMACQKPSEYGVSIRHWTHELLAQVAQAEKIVDSISPRYVGEILKKSGVTSA